MQKGYPPEVAKKIGTAIIHAGINEEIKCFREMITDSSDESYMENLALSVYEKLEGLPGTEDYRVRTRGDMLKLCAALEHTAALFRDEIADAQYAGSKQLRQEKPDCSPAGERE